MPIPSEKDLGCAAFAAVGVTFFVDRRLTDMLATVPFVSIANIECASILRTLEPETQDTDHENE
jgi:hypothetical protein